MSCAQVSCKPATNIEACVVWAPESTIRWGERDRQVQGREHCSWYSSDIRTRVDLHSYGLAVQKHREIPACAVGEGTQKCVSRTHCRAREIAVAGERMDTCAPRKLMSALSARRTGRTRWWRRAAHSFKVACLVTPFAGYTSCRTSCAGMRLVSAPRANNRLPPAAKCSNRYLDFKSQASQYIISDIGFPMLTGLISVRCNQPSGFFSFLSLFLLYLLFHNIL